MKLPIFQSSINEPLTKDEKWKELVESIDKTEVVKNFIDRINTNTEKQTSKRSVTKFAMAKKKFAKKPAMEGDIGDDLLPEPYEKNEIGG